MAKDFHGKGFDAATVLKLEIFRGYIREWLPVFLSKAHHPRVNVYDFFAGPGTSAAGDPGSPLIVVDELERYLADPRTTVADGVHVTLYFNDRARAHIEALGANLAPRLPTLPCGVRLECQDFQDAFAAELPELRRPDSANLVILDQFGLKQVNRGVFLSLVDCPTTDVLFFLSSSYVRRFIETDEIQQHFPLAAEEIRAVGAKDIHRYLCQEYYRRLLPPGKVYYLAPFSIEKDGGANIYGLIFGSNNLLGFEKFLGVCWDKDKVTGEANYNIDDDLARDGQPSLFAEYNVIKKQDWFRRRLAAFLEGGQQSNLDVYRFTVESGFLPQHANAELRQMQDAGRLLVTDLATGRPARKHAYYVTWEHFHDSRAIVRFDYGGGGA